MRRKYARRIIDRAEDFFQPFVAQLDSWRQRFIPHLIRGIARSEGLVVTEIVREAFESNEEFMAGYKSFSRHLNSDVWDEQEERGQRKQERFVARSVKKLTPIAVDDGELAKPYASKMERLGWIKDSDQDKIVPGYWCFESYGAEHPEAPVPLVNFTYSLQDEKTPSRQHARRQGYQRLAQATEGRGVLVEDRGFDGDENFEDLNEAGFLWLIRLVGNRELHDASGTSLGIVEDFVATWRLRFVGQAHGRLVDGEEIPHVIAYDYLRVRIPRVAGEYTLIAVRRCSAPAEGGMYLLTNVPVLCPPDAERLIRFYHHRWRVEDSIQFLKEALGLQGVRTLNFRPLRRLVQATYWIMGMLSELRIHLSPHQLTYALRRTAFFPRPVRMLHYRLLAALQVLWESPG